MLSTPERSELPQDMTAASQPNTEVIVIDSDGDDENDLGLALKRARTKNLQSSRHNSVASSPSVKGSSMPSLFTRKACEVLRLRPKKETPAPEQALADLPQVVQSQGERTSLSVPGVTAKSASSQLDVPSTSQWTTVDLFGESTIEKGDNVQPEQDIRQAESPRFSKSPSRNRSLENTSTNPVPDATSQSRTDHDYGSPNRKRPYQILTPDVDGAQIPNSPYKKARAANPAANRLPSAQEKPTPKPPTINKTIRPTQRREDNKPPPEKIQIPIARLSQADRDLFRDFEQRHAVPRKVHFASTLSANTGPDPERVRKAAEYAPSKQEQRRAEYRNKARAKRAGDIHNNIVQNARKEYPNKNEAAIQREAQARVDAWRRDRAAEDKAERLLNLDGLKAQQRRAVTNLSSATTVDFLGKNRVVVVFTVFQSEPFDENDGLNDTDREYNLVRLDSFIDMKKANDLATKQIYGGLTVNKDQRKEVNLRYDDKRDGQVYGSARLPDGKKFICYVGKENKQVGQLDPRFFEGKKVREDALKLYQKRFDVISVCVRSGNTDEEGDTVADSDPREQQEARESSVGSGRSRGTVALATIPEGSVNPLRHCVYDHKIHGSYVDRTSANKKALEVMKDLWRPEKARLGALIRYRDKVMPSINAAKDALSSDIDNIELTFNPELHDSGYNFLSSTV